MIACERTISTLRRSSRSMSMKQESEGRWEINRT